jgi:hypothetical protein
MHGTDKNKIHVHKLFIYITREVFVRHTVSRNFKMLDDTRDQNLLIPTRHHVVPKSIGKRQTKEDTNGFSGCNNVTMTDSRAVTRPAKGGAAGLPC